jgi:hypothetical protein
MRREPFRADPADPETKRAKTLGTAGSQPFLVELATFLYIFLNPIIGHSTSAHAIASLGEEAQTESRPRAKHEGVINTSMRMHYSNRVCVTFSGPIRDDSP